jgi:hypothetical protein
MTPPTPLRASRPAPGAAGIPLDTPDRATNLSSFDAPPIPRIDVKRFCACLATVLVLAACRIEPTPERFIDHQQTAAEEIAESEEELRSRLASMMPALAAGRQDDVLTALNPHPAVLVIGPNEGEELTEPRAIADRLAGSAGGADAAPGAIRVSVGPRNNVAWFSTELRSIEGAEASYRFSGVFLRHEGDWRLIQGHISRPINSTPQDPPAGGGTQAGVG